AGTGSIGNLTTQASRVSPGNSPGILHVASALLNASSVFVVDLNGPTPGTGYDQLRVDGDVGLASSVLNVTPRCGASPGSQFTIISAESRHVTGTFSGLPEGATLDLGGQHFSITYKGGDGNDVVLTALDHPPAATYYLSEGATGAFFDEDVLIA